MSDINLLPDDLRDKEAKERQRSSAPASLPMSTPIVDSAKSKGGSVLPTGKPIAPFSREEEDHYKHLREASYIKVNESGHLIHEDDAKSETGAARASWWRGINWPRREVRTKKNSAATPPVTSATRSNELPIHSLPQPQKPATKNGIGDKQVGWWQELWNRLFVKRPQSAASQSAATAPLGPNETVKTVVPSSPGATAAPLRQNSGLIKEMPTTAKENQAINSTKAPLTAPPTESSKSGEGEHAGKRLVMSEPNHFGPPPIGINLIPQEWLLSTDFSPTLRLKILAGLVGLAFLTLVGSVAGQQWLSISVNSQLNNLEAEKTRLTDRVNDLENDEQAWRHTLVTLTNLKSLLDNHVNALVAFESLEKNIIPEVQLLSLALDSNGDILVRGETSSYELLARQIKSFEAMPLSRAVELRNMSLEKRQVLKFELVITFDPAHLKYAYQQ